MRARGTLHTSVPTLARLVRYRAYLRARKRRRVVWLGVGYAVLVIMLAMVWLV